jgi:hypothetical protein
VVVLPARSGKLRDKAKVEVGVQVVERWILAVLCNRQFFSLGELNSAIGPACACTGRMRHREPVPEWLCQGSAIVGLNAGL